MVVRVCPEQRAGSSAKGFNSQSGYFRDAYLPSEIQNQHTSIGDSLVVSDEIHILWHATVKRVVSVQQCSGSVGRLRRHFLYVQRMRTLRAAVFLSPRISTLPCSAVYDSAFIT